MPMQCDVPGRSCADVGSWLPVRVEATPSLSQLQACDVAASQAIEAKESAREKCSLSLTPAPIIAREVLDALLVFA